MTREQATIIVQDKVRAAREQYGMWPGSYRPVSSPQSQAYYAAVDAAWAEYAAATGERVR